MYRHRIHFYPDSIEAFTQFLAVGDEYNKVAAEKGWAQGTYWTPTIGEVELVAEFDYPDLATFERENAEFMQEPAAMAVMQKMESVPRTRPERSEMLEPPPAGFG